MKPIWRGMTQSELDQAYNQAAYAPNMQEVLARYVAKSEAVRDVVGAPRRFAYGTGQKEGVDVYSPEPGPGRSHGPAPINLFIHGGAWRSGDARDYAFPAELFVSAGAHFIAVDFDWVQDRDGDLTAIADQVRQAIAWVARNAHTFGGCPEQIHLSAHSSGAHLASVALLTDWQAAFSLPADIIKSALLCSGMYDMEPVRRSSRSSYVSFTDESEKALSAMRHLDRITVPVAVAYGSNETPEFQRQSKEFAQSLQDRNHPAELIVGEGLNHFEILETLSGPEDLLGAAALRLMGLSA